MQSGVPPLCFLAFALDDRSEVTQLEAEALHETFIKLVRPVRRERTWWDDHQVSTFASSIQATRDGTKGELLMEWTTYLPSNRHVQGKPELGRDIVRGDHSSSGQTQNDGVVFHA